MSTEEVFAIEVVDGVIRLSGDLDAHTAPRLDDVVRELLESGADRIVVDMGGVEFVDSSGLRSLIRARSDGADGREVVVGKVEIPDVLATVCQALGLSPDLENTTSLGRPVRLTEGTPVEGILA